MIDLVSAKIEGLKSIIQVHLLDAQRHEKVLNGIRVSLFGLPNVGKSTLMNWIGMCLIICCHHAYTPLTFREAVNREASIVSPYPGTTRDIVELSLDFRQFLQPRHSFVVFSFWSNTYSFTVDGFPIILSDTAGLRETRDPVEIIGIERARTKYVHEILIINCQIRY